MRFGKSSYPYIVHVEANWPIASITFPIPYLTLPIGCIQVVTSHSIKKKKEKKEEENPPSCSLTRD